MLAINISKTPIANLDELGAKRNTARFANWSIKRLVIHAWASEGPAVTSQDHRSLEFVCGCNRKVSSVEVGDPPVTYLDESISKRNALHLARSSLEHLIVRTRAIERLAVIPVDRCGLS
jgi:hypothetical protein